jgi:Asp-tRNA(Asn)/Glu-tRNA(Gln) amidotransferase A subunit family amidase
MTTKFLDRRTFAATLAKYGMASALFTNALYSLAQGKAEITKAMIAEAAALDGLAFDDKQVEMMLDDLRRAQKGYDALHDLHLANSVAPALVFNPVLPGMTYQQPKRPMRMSKFPWGNPPLGRRGVPIHIEDVAFFTVRELAELVRTRRVSSTALTEMYLERLRRYDPLLKFVITLTTDRALAQARQADREIAAGKYRGPLHGLPWGAKDLLAVKGYKTTWGAGGYEDQQIDEDATVVQRLDKAGAVLVAKLTLGALAMGDVWFGGMTRNPWKPDQGSSGSSAGPASATAAGCVAFAIGSETLGSISSPSTRCGVTGLRPTFGRVPRTGAMALSWSMDKLGPLCRSVEDCAIVLDAIYGPDNQDGSVHDIGYTWDALLPVRSLRVGYTASDFEHKPPDSGQEKPEQREQRLMMKKFDDAALDVLRNKLGIKLIPVELPKLPWQAMRPLLTAEGAAAFDELTRTGRDKLLTAQGPNDWPNAFRVAHLTPAVEYINANRARTLGMQQMAEVMKKVDVVVAPTFSNQLLITNLTGHPAVILPNGFRPDGTPVSLTFIGDLFGEGKLCAVANAYQRATDFHLKHPNLDVKPQEKPAAEQRG